MDIKNKLINEAQERVARYRDSRVAKLDEAEFIRQCDERAQKWMDRFDMFAAAALPALIASQMFADLCREDCDTEADEWLASRALSIATNMVYVSSNAEFDAYDEATIDAACFNKEGGCNVQQES